MKKRTRDWTAIRWMIKAVGSEKHYIVILTVVQTVLGASTVGYALFLRGLIDGAVDKNVRSFWMYAGLLAGLVVFLMLLRYLKRYLDERARSGMENSLKYRLFHHILTKDYGQIRAIHSAEWMNRLTSDTKVVADGMVQVLPNLCEMSARLIAAVAALILMQPEFTVVLVPGGILLILLTFLFRTRLKGMHAAIQEQDGALRVFYQERLSSQMVLRVFGKENTTEDHQEEYLDNHQEARLARNRFSNLCNAGFALAMNGAYVLGAVYCGYGILKGTMTYGTFTAVLQLVGQVQTPFANISGIVPQFFAMIASSERLMEVESFRCDTETDESMIADFTEFGLRDASFTYRDYGESDTQSVTTVLTGFDAEIHRNEFVVFTGPSGCGKSTALKILMSLYPLDNGICYIRDAVSEHQMTSAQRNLFSYVPQGNALIKGSVREVVAFGDPEEMNETERIEKALKTACAWEFVSELDSGIDTQLGEHGSGLSEGQMQRLSIARAIFSHRPILLLDEATSALDAETEKMLLRHLKSNRDLTVIMVTHRPAAFEVADRIIDFAN